MLNVVFFRREKSQIWRILLACENGFIVKWHSFRTYF